MIQARRRLVVRRRCAPPISPLRIPSDTAVVATHSVASTGTASSWYKTQLAIGTMQIEDVGSMVALHIAFNEERIRFSAQARKRRGDTTAAGNLRVAATSQPHMSCTTPPPPAAAEQQQAAICCADSGLAEGYTDRGLVERSAAEGRSPVVSATASMHRSSAALLQLAADNPAISQELQAIAYAGGFVGAAALRWVSHVGRICGSWSSAISAVFGNPAKRAAVTRVAFELLALLAERVRSTASSDALRTQYISQLADELDRLSGGCSVQCIKDVDRDADTLLEYLRSHASRFFAVRAAYSDVLTPLSKQLIDASSKILQHSESPRIVMEAQAYSDILLRHDITSAAFNLRAAADLARTELRGPLTDASRSAAAVCLQATAVPLSVCGLLVGDIGVALDAFRCAASAETMIRIRDASWRLCGEQRLACPSTLNLSLAQFRARSGLRCPPSAHHSLPPGDDSFSSPSWLESLAQFDLSSRYSAGSRLRGADQSAEACETLAVSHGIAALDDALARSSEGAAPWAHCLAFLSDTCQSRLSHCCDVLDASLIEMLCRRGFVVAARLCNPARAAATLWKQGLMGEACNTFEPEDVAANFDALIESRCDGIGEWHAALALLGVIVRVPSSAHRLPENVIVRALKSFGSSDAPPAVVDVLIRLQRNGADSSSTPHSSLMLKGMSMRLQPSLLTYTRVHDGNGVARALASAAARAVRNRRTTPSAHRDVLQAQVDAGMWEEALVELREHILPARLKPSPRTTLQLQTLLTDHGHSDTAAQINRAVASANVGGILVHPAANGIAPVERLVAENRWAAALVALRDSGNSELMLRYADAVLRMAVASGSWVGACGAMKLIPLHDRDRRLNPAIALRTLSVLAREGRWFEACVLFSTIDALSKGSRGYDERALSFLAKACRVASRWSQSLAVFAEVSRRGKGSFSALAEVVAACLGAGFPLASIQMWLRVPTVHASQSVGISLGGDLGSSSIATLSCPVGLCVAFAIVAAQSRHGGAGACDAWYQATRLFVSALQNPSLVPALSAECITSVIDVCCRAGQWRRAFQIFAIQTDAAAGSPALPPPNRHAVHMLMACWKNGEWRAAIGVYSKACAVGAVDALVTDRAIEALCSAGNWQPAVELALSQGHASDHAWARIALVPSAPTRVAARALARMSLFPVRRKHKLGQRVVELIEQLQRPSTTTTTILTCDERSATLAVLRRLLRD